MIIGCSCRSADRWMSASARPHCLQPAPRRGPVTHARRLLFHALRRGQRASMSASTATHCSSSSRRCSASPWTRRSSGKALPRSAIFSPAVMKRRYHAVDGSADRRFRPTIFRPLMSRPSTRNRRSARAVPVPHHRLTSRGRARRRCAVSLGSRLWLSSLYRTVRTVLRNWLRLWVGLCGGFSDQCCASTTLSIFDAGMKGRAEIPPEAGTTLAFAHSAFRGNCMGEILLSAFVRSRVHNRTRDRGGKPIQLA